MKVTIEGKISDGALLQMQLDGKEILNGNGQASVDLATGTYHPLQWFVRGDQGATYTVGIVAPPKATFSHSGTLDSTGRDAGIQWVYRDEP